MLYRAGEGLDVLKNKALMMGENLDKQEKDLENLKNEVDKAHEGIVSANARLKQVLFHVKFYFFIF